MKVKVENNTDQTRKYFDIGLYIFGLRKLLCIFLGSLIWLTKGVGCTEWKIKTVCFKVLIDITFSVSKVKEHFKVVSGTERKIK